MLGMLELHRLRRDIDQIDDDILSLIAKRQQLSVKIGIIKNQNKIAVFDPEREVMVKNHYCQLSKKYNLKLEFVDELFNLIVAESRRIQMK